MAALEGGSASFGERFRANKESREAARLAEVHKLLSEAFKGAVIIIPPEIKRKEHQALWDGKYTHEETIIKSQVNVSEYFAAVVDSLGYEKSKGLMPGLDEFKALCKKDDYACSVQYVALEDDENSQAKLVFSINANEEFEGVRFSSRPSSILR